jgi:predicted AAA+ superfamily ATPase
MLLRSTLEAVLRDPVVPRPPSREVPRTLAPELKLRPGSATVLTGVRRCGKSTLQAQLMRRATRPFYCNFEDTRLFGMGPDDFPAFLATVD